MISLDSWSKRSGYSPALVLKAPEDVSQRHPRPPLPHALPHPQGEERPLDLSGEHSHRRGEWNALILPMLHPSWGGPTLVDGKNSSQLPPMHGDLLIHREPPGLSHWAPHGLQYRERVRATYLPPHHPPSTRGLRVHHFVGILPPPIHPGTG